MAYASFAAQRADELDDGLGLTSRIRQVAVAERGARESQGATIEDPIAAIQSSPTAENFAGPDMASAQTIPSPSGSSDDARPRPDSNPKLTRLMAPTAPSGMG